MAFLPMALRPSPRPTVVVVLPSPAGVGLMAVTRMSLPGLRLPMSLHRLERQLGLVGPVLQQLVAGDSDLRSHVLNGLHLGLACDLDITQGHGNNLGLNCGSYPSTSRLPGRDWPAIMSERPPSRQQSGKIPRSDCMPTAKHAHGSFSLIIRSNSRTGIHEQFMGRIFEVRKHTMFARWNRMAKQFAKIGKEITIAVKSGGADPGQQSRAATRHPERARREHAQGQGRRRDQARQRPRRHQLHRSASTRATRRTAWPCWWKPPPTTPLAPWPMCAASSPSTRATSQAAAA